MSHFLAFGFQVAAAGFVGFSNAGYALNDLNSRFFQRFDLVRIIRHQADAGDSEVPKDCPGQGIIPQITFKAELFVGFDSIGALILQLIGSKFVHEPDATALLLLVDNQSPAFASNLFESDFELGSAVATKAVKDIAGQALGMDPEQWGLATADVAHFEDGCLFDAILRTAFKAMNAE
jgi:hypothetical protein